MFAALYFYGRNVYAAVPAALGGGLPIIVQFSAVKDKMSELEELGIQPESIQLDNQSEPSTSSLTDDSGGSGLTRKVNLIAQTDSHYIVSCI